ncbi:hypothetical protein FXO37_19686 [Capsicum annuum]|nr:hypothetical protein FXO37_19686 [Capsicum annuum]
MQISPLARRAMIALPYWILTIVNWAYGAMRWYRVGSLENDYCHLDGLRDALKYQLIHIIVGLQVEYYLMPPKILDASYYPWAWHLKDNATVECNDNGAELFEVQVNSPMDEVLHHSDSRIKDIVTFPQGVPWSLDCMGPPRRALATAQLSHFDCGGIAISVCLSHKVGDEDSGYRFLKDWAALTRDSNNIVLSPYFVQDSILPSPPNLGPLVSPVSTKKQECVEKTFDFSPLKLNAVKASVKSEGIQHLTRNEVVNALVYKYAANAASSSRSHQLVLYLNIRESISPQLPPTSIGNMLTVFSTPIHRGDLKIAKVHRYELHINSSNSIPVAELQLINHAQKIEEHKIRTRERQNKRARSSIFSFNQPKLEGGNCLQFHPKPTILAPSSASAPVPKFKDGSRDLAPSSKSQGSISSARTNPLCQTCGKNHKDTCKAGSDIFHVHVYSLLDLGASLSFVTPYIAGDFEISPKILAEPFLVSTPVGKTIIGRRVYRHCPIMIFKKATSADLAKLEMINFDIILGMDWIHSCYATVDCRTRVVQFQFSNEPVLEWKGSTSSFRGQLVSYLRARKMISKGCMYHLVLIKDPNFESSSLESVLVVNEYSDVFSEDLPGISPKREINFGIDLLPDTQPISILPYRMAPAELKELKD